MKHLVGKTLTNIEASHTGFNVFINGSTKEIDIGLSKNFPYSLVCKPTNTTMLSEYPVIEVNTKTEEVYESIREYHRVSLALHTAYGGSVWVWEGYKHTV